MDCLCPGKNKTRRGEEEKRRGARLKGKGKARFFFGESKGQKIFFSEFPTKKLAGMVIFPNCWDAPNRPSPHRIFFWGEGEDPDSNTQI